MDKKMFDFYSSHLLNDVLPFWQRAIDKKNGGVFTCFNNLGTQLVSTDKYTWSQGRYAWLCAKSVDMIKRGLLCGDSEVFFEQARKTVSFLDNYAIMDNGNCAFLLSETGEKKEPVAGEGYDTSFFADCFVVLGFIAYARISKDRYILQRALKLFDAILKRLITGNVRSEPYPVPQGVRAQSFSMIMLNVTQEILCALKQFGHKRANEFRALSYFFLHDIMDVFCEPSSRLVEMRTQNPEFEDTILCRHVNPGHAIECMWFVMVSAKELNLPFYIEQAQKVIAKAFEYGWDNEYGGLLRFVDKDGGMPRGSKRIGGAFEQLIIDTWDSKLWWPHSETLYTTLLAYKLTGSRKMYEIYEKTFEYVFKTFPNDDKAVGEWIQIRNREGKPINKVVALPVKDPYHIMRNLMLIIELLHEM